MWFASPFVAVMVGIASPAPVVAALEPATTISRPAAPHSCWIVRPTFALETAREKAQAARYPGGGKLSRPIASPCPARIVGYDI